MMGRTHLMLGAASLWLLRPLPDLVSTDDLAPMLALAAFGALLPDLDASSSTLRHLRIGGLTPFVPLSQVLHGRFGHRGALHSLWGLGVLALLVLPLLIWLPWRWYLSLLLGYASHLAGDACTRSGIPLLYPRLERRHLLPSFLRLTTGSPAEEVVFVMLALSVLLLLLSAIKMTNF